MLTAAVVYVAALLALYRGEARYRRRVFTAFERFVPASVARELLGARRVEVALGAERVDLTVFFCDVRGFTAMSEVMAPSKLRDMLNCYYDRLVQSIRRHDGTVMAFVGDEVFAVWGAPIPTPDHAAKAFACALEVQSLWVELTADLAEIDVPPVFYGIGLHTGEAVAGYVGNGARLQYTVLGDTVNVGARLSSVAEAGEVVCSEDVVRALPHPPELMQLGDVALKGVSHHRCLWRVPAPDFQHAI